MKAIIICVVVIALFLVAGNSSGNSAIDMKQYAHPGLPTDSTLVGSTSLDSLYIDSCGVFTDERDGKTYKWVRIGDQVWMAQNLAFKADSGCSPFRGRKKQAEKEGYLYDWETAQKVPPKGWHLPSKEEYMQLITYVGGTNEVDTYKLLIDGDKYGLNFKNNGEYWANFPKAGKGMYVGGSLHPVKTTTLWTSTYFLTASDKDTVYRTFGVRYRAKNTWLSFTGNKLNRYPVRCIKD